MGHGPARGESPIIKGFTTVMSLLAATSIVACAHGPASSEAIGPNPPIASATEDVQPSTAATLGTHSTPYSLAFPMSVDGVAVNEIPKGIASAEKGSTIALEGFLALDFSSCSKAGADPASCTGVFLWDRSLPDPDFGGSRLAVVGVDVTKTLAPALGAQDWGMPVVLSGTPEDTQCDANRCGGKLELKSLLWDAPPVPTILPEDQSVEPEPMAAVAGTLFKVPQSWTTSTNGPVSVVSPSGAETQFTIRRRDDRVIFDSAEGGVIDSYPNQTSIAYHYGNGFVAWVVEGGTSYETRRTLIGYDDGNATYELAFQWSDSGIWTAASLAVLQQIVGQLPVDEAAAE